ncbi:hypothetical protein SSS_02575 [Sarcoptes scabiei]|nr:hypothetical protein SSS_02575 [Sarcoptes scabiei]
MRVITKSSAEKKNVLQRSFDSSLSTYELKNWFKINQITSTPKHSSNKNGICKNKTRLKQSSDFFQTKEREKFKNILALHLSDPIECPDLFDHPKQSTFGQQIAFKNLSLQNETITSNQSAAMKTKFPASYLHQNDSHTSLNSIKATISSSLSSTSSLSSEPKTTEKLNQILTRWKLPERSIEFKNSVLNQLSALLPNKLKIKCDGKKFDHENDERLLEKIKKLEILRQNRYEIYTKVKSIWNVFPRFAFYDRLKYFIPYQQNDFDLNKSLLEHEKKKRQKESTIAYLQAETIQIIYDEVDGILADNCDDKLIVSAFSINIYVRDLKTLDQHNWLNDSVIDFYFNLIAKRSQENQDRLPSVYCFSTYFFTRLTSGSKIGRWANKLDFFSYDLLLFPIHFQSHWRLAESKKIHRVL